MLSWLPFSYALLTIRLANADGAKQEDEPLDSVVPGLQALLCKIAQTFAGVNPSNIPSDPITKKLLSVVRVCHPITSGSAMTPNLTTKQEQMAASEQSPQVRLFR